MGIPVDLKTTLCVTDCVKDLTSYYYYSGTCYQCDTSCLTCYGGNINNCFLCKDPSQVQYLGSCSANCPNHFFNSNGVCIGKRFCYTIHLIIIECHASCLECSGSDLKSCSSCPSGRYLFNSQCLAACPSGYFPSGSTCSQCISPCLTCKTASSCSTCVSGTYFVQAENKCITAENCYSESTYPDDTNGTCSTCSESCIYCTGPTSSDCVNCNYLFMYAKSYTSNECKVLQCAEGYYANVSKILKQAICTKCEEGCATCDGSTRQRCFSCQSKFHSAESPIKGHISCLKCSEINSGLTENAKGECEGNIMLVNFFGIILSIYFPFNTITYHIEICGDGLNLGYFACDDGNNIDGDGCSKDCKVEDGYECYKSLSGKDYCRDILPPSAKLQLKKGKELSIYFSEPVVVQADSNIYYNFYITMSNITLKKHIILLQLKIIYLIIP